jgi:hypothetical protein
VSAGRSSVSAPASRHSRTEIIAICATGPRRPERDLQMRVSPEPGASGPSRSCLWSRASRSARPGPTSDLPAPWQHFGNSRLARSVRARCGVPQNGTFRTAADSYLRGVSGSGPCPGNWVEVRVLSSASATHFGFRRRIPSRGPHKGGGHCVATSGTARATPSEMSSR